MIHDGSNTKRSGIAKLSLFSFAAIFLFEAVPLFPSQRHRLGPSVLNIRELTGKQNKGYQESSEGLLFSAGTQTASRWQPYASPPAAICEPAGCHMQARTNNRRISYNHLFRGLFGSQSRRMRISFFFRRQNSILMTKSRKEYLKPKKIRM